VTPQTAAHTYADHGTYTVTLTIADAAHSGISTTSSVVVANVAPTATFSFTPTVDAGSEL